jgi:hypothetical protein
MEGKVDLILNKLKTMDSLEEQLREQRNIIAGLGLKIDMLQKTNESLLNMQTDVNTLKTEISVANSEINTLKSEVEVLHRHKAERQILIENVPHVSKENLPAILHKIMLSLKCEDIPTSFPIDAHRLGKYDPARKRPPAILAEFNSTFVRNNVMTQWRNKKMLFADEICPEHKNFGENPKERQQIYINKNHPPMLKALLREARQLKKFGYKITYEYANNVYIRKSLADEDAPIKINSKEDVLNLMK